MKTKLAKKTTSPKPAHEMLDVVDRYGTPTGKVVEREVAHRRGFRHRTAHVWLVRRSRKHPGQIEVLLQKRSRDKDSFPGCHDISSAGHIPAGEEWIPSALRELREELGVVAEPKDLHFVGKRSFSSIGFFHGRRFVNRQVSAVYFLWCDREAESFAFDPSEISSVRWMDAKALKASLSRKSFPNCISRTEIDWLLQHPAIFPVAKGRTVRFSAHRGPRALFDRVRYIIPPSACFDRCFLLRYRRFDRVVPNIYCMFSDLSHDPSAWRLVGAETRRDIGKFVRSHWNVTWHGRWYRLVLDSRGNIYNFKELPDGEPAFGRVVRDGPDYDFAERVNRALMETTLDRTGWSTGAKGLMN